MCNLTIRTVFAVLRSQYLIQIELIPGHCLIFTFLMRTSINLMRVVMSRLIRVFTGTNKQIDVFSTIQLNVVTRVTHIRYFMYYKVKLVGYICTYRLFSTIQL